MEAVRPWHAFKMAILPLFKRLFLVMKMRPAEKRVEALSRRLGLLQLGTSAPLFESVPGLSHIATGGLGARRSLAAIRQTLKGPTNVNWDVIAQAMEEIDTFLRDANGVLDAHDRSRPRKDRLFVAREGLKGLF